MDFMTMLGKKLFFLSKDTKNQHVFQPSLFEYLYFSSFSSPFIHAYFFLFDILSAIGSVSYLRKQPEKGGTRRCRANFLDS